MGRAEVYFSRPRFAKDFRTPIKPRVWPLPLAAKPDDEVPPTVEFKAQPLEPYALVAVDLSAGGFAAVSFFFSAVALDR